MRFPPDHFAFLLEHQDMETISILLLIDHLCCKYPDFTSTEMNQEFFFITVVNIRNFIQYIVG